MAGPRALVRWFALAVSVVTLGLTCYLAAQFPGDSEPFARSEYAWLAAIGAPLDVRFSLALDGLSLWLVVLTALLTVVCVLVSWEAIREQAVLFYRLLLILETGLLGVFTAQDIVLFYVFFECTLIPLFFIIGVWGSEDRRYAAVKFFLFTLAGSLLTFLGIVAIVLWDYAYGGQGRMTFSIAELTAHLRDHPMPVALQTWLFLALFAGFAIKVPLFPLHTWLPLAHVQAPTAGSVLLAGVLLKIGTYGFLRFNIPLLPAATALLAPWLLGLAVAGIIYGALVALAQADMKKLIAYSSVSHLGFCMLGLFALNPLGAQGGTLQMINHGLSTGGLFALVGMLYERYHTRKIADMGGLARRVPRLAFFMLVMTLSSIGLPGLNGFVGELLILLGMFQRAFAMPLDALGAFYRAMAVLAVSGVVLGAWYMLQLVERVFFGPLQEPPREQGHAPVRDLAFRESLALVLLTIPIVWIGLCPKFFLDRIAPTLDRLVLPTVQSSATFDGSVAQTTPLAHRSQ